MAQDVTDDAVVIVDEFIQSGASRTPRGNFHRNSTSQKGDVSYSREYLFPLHLAIVSQDEYLSISQTFATIRVGTIINQLLVVEYTAVRLR